MTHVAIVTGGLLIVLGLAGFFGTGSQHPTALIPVAFGLPIGILGLVASRAASGVRKHAMHAAAGLALLGFLATVRGLVQTFVLIAGGTVARPVAAVDKGIMAVLCGVFVALAIRSFILARRCPGRQVLAG